MIFSMLGEVVSFSLLCFTSIFFIVNPISAAPVFMALTQGWDDPARVRSARRAVIVAASVLILFSITGNLIFRMFGITLGAFRLAGGMLLLRVALDMMHGRPTHTKTTPEDHLDASEKDDIGASPMGVPQLAGPGAIATVILLPGEPRILWRIFPVLASILLSLFITYLVLRGADKVQKRIGDTGLRILSKLTGLLIAAVAMQFLANGVGDLLPEILKKAATG